MEDEAYICCYTVDKVAPCNKEGGYWGKGTKEIGSKWDGNWFCPEHRGATEWEQKT